jgi:molybdate transport system substrate-binding protein
MLAPSSLRNSAIRPTRWAAFALAALLIFPRAVDAGEVKVAVAANFTDAIKEIGAAFEKATGHKPVFSLGASGQLYTQITQAAPFEVFLSADQERPKKAVEDGFAVKDSLFTYATGKIVLFSKNKDLVKGAETLKGDGFTKIAIASPQTAPYGAAAIEAMKKLGVYDAFSAKIVQGNNIAQTYQFVDTGNAEIGFVALSQVIGKDIGSQWIVPAELYSVIAQDAVLLKTGENSEAAKAFLAFLKGSEAKAVKAKFGYGEGTPGS